MSEPPNYVPIEKDNVEKRKQELRQREIEYAAFMKWQDAGYPPGDGKEFWLAAELAWEAKAIQKEAAEEIMAEHWCTETRKKSEEKEKEVAPSANHPQMPLQSEKKEVKKTRPWFCQSLLERLFPMLASIPSDTSQLKDCEKSQEVTT